jgi:hypothetical protein
MTNKVAEVGRRPARWRGVIIALTLGALLGACSLAQTAYNQSPTLASWWVGRYVTLSSEQQQALDGALTRLLAWHRQTELPQWEAWLRGQAELATAEADSTKVCQRAEALRPRALAWGQAAAAEALPLLRSLSNEQMRQLRQRVAQRQAEWEDEQGLTNPKLWREQRMQTTTERAELWYGELNEAQQAWIAQQTDAQTGEAAEWAAQRRAKQSAFLAVAMAVRDPAVPAEQAQRTLRAWWEQAIAWTPQAQQSSCNTWAGLHARASAAQREHLKNKLLSFAEDARALHAP